MTINNNNDIQALANMSLSELKQLLSCVNQDIKSIKRKERAAAKSAAINAISELAECNIISQRFTGKQYAKPVENRRIKEDIQIQKDILEFLDNGGHIITRVSRKKIKPLSVFSRTVSP